MNHIRLVVIVLSIAILSIGFVINENNYETTTTDTDAETLDTKTPHQVTHEGALKPRHKIFDGDLQGIDLNLIPGWTEADDFDNWDPPPGLSRDFPSYIAGFDNSSRPIWVLEWGRFNFGKYVRGRKRDEKLLKKYFRYMAWLALKSHSLRSTAENPVEKHAKITDFEGFKAEFVTDKKVFNFMKNLAAGYNNYYIEYVGPKFMLNINSISEIWLNGLYGVGFLHFRSSRLQKNTTTWIYGTNKYEWAPKLAQAFPVDQLPEWYEGKKGSKPYYVVG